MFFIHAGVNDYLPVVNNGLIFQPATASQPQCGDILLVNDNVLESAENFLAVLSRSDTAVTINPNTAVVAIEDDDSKLMFVLF